MKPKAASGEDAMRWAAVVFSLLAAAVLPAPAVPSRLDPRPCPARVAAEGVTCGSLEVPEDYGRPEGRRIALAIAVVAAEAPGKGLLHGAHVASARPGLESTAGTREGPGMAGFGATCVPFPSVLDSGLRMGRCSFDPRRTTGSPVTIV